MQALILAAGMGKRLGNLIQDGTKCMLRMNGKSLIERTIEQLVANKISPLVIVTGYKSDVLKNFIASKFGKNNLGEMEIEYIENPDYAATNNIYSLYLAREKLKKDDTILIESDLIFRPTLFPALIESPHKNVAVVSAWEDWMDGTVTTLNDECEIENFIGKQEQITQDKARYFKTVNVYKFSKEFSAKYYVPFLEAYQTAFGKNVYYEEALKVISFLKSDELHALKISGDDWYEIDNENDYHEAERRFACD